MSVNELKPCPFCGGEAKIIDLPEEMNAGGICVECTVCRASSVACWPIKEEGNSIITEAWNRRV